MGIEPASLRFLLDARRSGVDFATTLCIGRQQLFLSAGEVRRTFADFGEDLPRETTKEMLASGPPEATYGADPHGHYAEGLLRHLGALTVESLDASGFEGAEIVVDLNVPLDAKLEGRYSVVFDGGTREHVFDAMTALRNCMRMVAPSGHLIAINPGDGYAGHGFYQFTPEFFYRALDRASGFAIERLLASDGRRWWEVTDPAALGRRVEAGFSRPTQLYVRARRVADRDPLQVAPQQSDYVAAWETRLPSAGGSRGLITLTARRLIGSLPVAIPRRLTTAWGLLERRRLGRRGYRRVKL